MGNPYIKLLSLIDPNEASADFAAARNTTAKKDIVYNVADGGVTGRTTVSLPDDVERTISMVRKSLPAIYAILALNVLVFIALIILGLVFCCRRRKSDKSAGSGATTLRARRGRESRPVSLNSAAAYRPVPAVSQSEHRYEPVSMAMT